MSKRTSTLQKAKAVRRFETGVCIVCENSQNGVLSRYSLLAAAPL